MKKKLKNMIKACDYFGIQFNFHYKTKEKYHTYLGGIVFIIFVIISILFVTSNFISLLKKENMTIISYKMQTPNTFPINFLNYSLTHAFGIKCSGPDSIIENDYFKIEANQVILTQKEGIVNYKKNSLDFNFCTKEDFYNKFNDSVDEYGLNMRYCFTNNNLTIQGLYTEDIYQYIELIAIMKKTDNFSIYYDLLTRNDCTFQLYHTDYGVNVNDYKNPIQPFLRQEFLKLSPITFNKMEVYYLSQIFNSYENYLFNNYHTKYFAGFSMFTLFELYKGLDRFEKLPQDYDKVAKYFIRVDSGEYVVSRKYMKISEFLANVSSIISELLFFLYIIMNRINTFYAKENLMTHIFQFKDSKKDQNTILIRKLKQNFATETYIQPNKLIKMYNKNLSEEFEKIKKKKNSTQILNIKKTNNNIKTNERKIFISNNNLSFTTDEILNNQFPISQHNKLSKDKNNNNLFNKEIFATKFISKYNKITFKYNILEILIYLFFPCLSWKKLKIKNILFKKGEAEFYLKTDIYSFIKNMQINEVMAKVILEPSQTRMIKFLSKPTISLSKTIKKTHIVKWNLNEENNISDDEIDNFCEEFKKLKTNIKKTNIEKRLFNMVSSEIDNLIG